MSFFSAIILGIIEGITELLPISSTAHLIIAADILHLERSEFLSAFEIIIQIGAILAVAFIYKDKFFKSLDIYLKLFIAFLPTGIAGLLLYPYIKALLSPNVSVIFMAITGLMFIAIEKFPKQNKDSLKSVSYKSAFLIGLSQMFALLPGVSRSGITIIFGIFLGLKRSLSVEFSFLLALPTVLAASGYEMLKSYEHLNGNIWLLLTGFVVSFIVSFAAVKWFLFFVKNHSFLLFGVYLIAFSVIYSFFI